MTKLFESGGTTNIGPQHQRGGGGGGIHQATVKAAPMKTSPFGKQGRAPVKAAAAKAPTTKAPDKKAPVDRGGMDSGQRQETWKSSQQEKNIADRAAGTPQTKIPLDKPVFKPSADDLSALHIGGEGLGMALTGDIKSQLDALITAEGSGRKDYDWLNMGAPQGVSEAGLFLSSAADHAANNVSVLTIDDTMLSKIRQAQSGTGETKTWGDTMMERYRNEGNKVYISGGNILSMGDPKQAELINQRNNIENFRMGALNMIEGHRLEQREVARSAITQGYQMAQQGLSNVGQAQAAQISADASRAVAGLHQQSARETEASRRAGALEIQTLAGTQQQEAIGVEGTEQRKTARVTGEEQRKGMRVGGEEERKAIQERTAGQLEIVGKEGENRLAEVEKQGQNMLSQLDRQFEGEGRLLEMTQDYNVDIQNNQQQFQSAENEKQRALDEGDQENFRYQVNVQATLEREKMELQRWEKNVDTMLSLGENPAALYYLNSTGMLKSILGGGGALGPNMNVADIVGDLTAIIDPAKVPNIQGFNSLSHIEQEILGFNLSATRGFGEGELQRTMQGGTPFTRGQESQIRVGGTRNPFETGNI